MYKKLLFLIFIFFFSLNPTYTQQVVFTSTPDLYTTNPSDDNDEYWVKDVTIKNVGIINSEHLEFSPTYYENGIVYVSSQKETNQVDKIINESFFELFYAELNPAGVPIHPEPFSARINSRLHEGPVAFGRNNKEVYFTRNNIKDGDVDTSKKGVIRMKIFGGRKGPEDWEDIRELSFNSDEYSCIHPTLSPDESKLYFSSNMPGGYGGYDLYVSERKGMSWGTPINLGSDINTELNEAFPSIHKSGTLFFASQGHDSNGGYDIFLINFKKNPMPPYLIKNLGKPFNTTNDDLGFALHTDGKKGFFTSNREDTAGKDDIYLFEAPNGIPGVSTPEKVKAMIAVFDNKTNKIVPNAQIRIFQQAVDGLVADNNYYDANVVAGNNSDELTMELVRRPSVNMPATNLLTDDTGFFNTEFGLDKRFVVLASKDGFLDNEAIISTYDTEGVITVRIGLDRIPEIIKSEPVVEELPPAPIIERGSVIIADNVFYDFGKSVIRAGAARDLDAMLNILNRYPEMMIELSAHTDSRGDARYNQKLSEARAASAKRYLMARGINGDRILTVGYGESNPRNGCVDGIKCSEIEHQYNRRTEMKVLKVGEPVDIEYIDNAPDKIDKAPKGLRKSR